MDNTKVAIIALSLLHILASCAAHDVRACAQDGVVFGDPIPMDQNVLAPAMDALIASKAEGHFQVEASVGATVDAHGVGASIPSNVAELLGRDFRRIDDPVLEHGWRDPSIDIWVEKRGQCGIAITYQQAERGDASFFVNYYYLRLDQNWKYQVSDPWVVY